MSARIVVIGGGVGGLAAAAMLARGGADVTLLERHDRLGGRAGRLEVGGYTFDTGPSWYLMPEAFEQFFSVMGRELHDYLDLHDLDPRYRVFFEDGSPGDKLDVVADTEANWVTFDSLRAGEGAAMREYARKAGGYYQMALDAFLYTTFENPLRVLSWKVVRQLPTLARLLTVSLKSAIGRRVTHPRLRQILGFHAVFLGSAPARVPSLYSLMSHLDLTQGVQYPRGGFYSLVEALEKVAREEGVAIRTGADVSRIVVDDATGVATGVALAGGETIAADVVVSGADLHHTETELLAARYRTHPESRWRKRKPGVSALLVMAGVEGALPELTHHNLFFSSDWDANFAKIVGDGELEPPFPASVYVSKVTELEPTAAPAGHENIVLLVPFPADTSLGADAASRAELTDVAGRYLDQVGDWAGVPDLRSRTTIQALLTPSDFATDIRAWRGSALGLEHTLGQSAMFRPRNVSKNVPNLLYVGSSTVPGIGVPICLISAELVVKRLMGDTSAGATPGAFEPGFLSRSPRRGVLGAAVRRESR